MYLEMSDAKAHSLTNVFAVSPKAKIGDGTLGVHSRLTVHKSTVLYSRCTVLYSTSMGTVSRVQ